VLTTLSHVDVGRRKELKPKRFPTTELEEVSLLTPQTNNSRAKAYRRRATLLPRRHSAVIITVRLPITWRTVVILSVLMASVRMSLVHCVKTA